MKILVISQYYEPEPFRISDICRELVQRGHDVTVVTGVPNYPEGVTYPGYEKGQKKDEICDGVKIHRCFTIPRKTGTLYRLLNYYSYAFTASNYVKKLDNDFDVVFINQLSPVMMAQAGIAYSRKNKTPLVMYCLDLWPESLVAGGISRDSVIYKFFHRVSRKIYRKMDAILITSRSFERYLCGQFGICREKISYLPQYAESLFDHVAEEKETQGWHFTFAGNMGQVQSVQTILEAAAKLTDVDAHFHLLGGGSDLERLQALAEEKKLQNVTFYGRRPLEEMPTFYRKSDAMLITMADDPVLSLTLPGKVQSYMAAGKAVIGAIDGETAAVIDDAQCGLCCQSRDADALAQCIRDFISDPQRDRYGRNARAYYEKHFTKEQFFSHLEESLKG